MRVALECLCAEGACDLHRGIRKRALDRHRSLVPRAALPPAATFAGF
jgi:hypothetical protein